MGRMTLLGAGPAVVAAALAPPTFAYVGEAIASGTNGNTTPFTASAAPLGNPSYIATRRVYVIAQGATSGRTIASATIDGVPATVHSNGGATNIAIFSAVVPSDTTGDIVLTMSDSQFGGIGVFIFITDNSLVSNPVPVAAYNDVTAATSNTKTVATLAGGCLLAACLWPDGTGGKTPSITSSTAGLSGESMTFPSSYFIGDKSNVTAQASSSVTIGWTGSFDSTLALFAIR